MRCHLFVHFSVFRIHDILVWIRIRGSMPLTNGSGSGSCYCRHWPSRCQQKSNFLTQFFLLVTFWRYIYIIKIKSQKESQNSRIQGYSYYFCMMIEGSRAGSGSIPLPSGSGSGRPKNTWIRNTDIFINLFRHFHQRLSKQLPVEVKHWLEKINITNKISK